jgi:hypothetical protein
MLAFRMDNLLCLVLEPGNIDKLQIGQPIVKDLREFIPDLPEPMMLMLAWTPDAMWVADQLKRGKPVAETLEKSLTREEVHVRPYQAAEDMTKAINQLHEDPRGEN